MNKHTRKILVLSVLSVLLSVLVLQAQQPMVMDSAEIKIALKKLLSLGSVLYIAAHPDDENTAVLAYMSRERLMRSGYLSLTRGGGGQNLIGTEKGPLMSVLRTYELLEARKIDGAEQFFTRAIDFGFSKTSEESIGIWGKESVLEDMVFVIRKFQPDVLLTRFSSERGGSGHGHHTASAILALEAFKAAGDPLRFPEQLKYVSTWSPKRIFWNDWRPYWRPQEITTEEKDKLIKVDVGTFNRLLGNSYSEIAAASRSMHKSQGFGALPQRGSWLDYFNLLDGAKAEKDLFDDIDTTWNRVPGSQKVRILLEKANNEFHFEQPHTIIPFLLQALKELNELPSSYWTIQKTTELKEVIRSCAGLWIEAIADSYSVTPGQELKITATIIDRSGFPFWIKKMSVPGELSEIELNQPLKENTPLKEELTMKIIGEEFTQPYWLRQKAEKGFFHTNDHQLKGLAVAPYPFNIKVLLASEAGLEVELEVPVLYRWRDPVEGEKLRTIVVTPPVTANFAEKVFYFPGKDVRSVEVTLLSGPDTVSGEVKLKLPPSWKVEPLSMAFDIEKPFTEKKVSFMVTPPEEDDSCNCIAEVTVGGKTYHYSQVVINYPHLPVITLHPEAEVRFVRVDLKHSGSRIGYIMGSGDDIPKYLRQIGYRVDLLSDEEMQNINLTQYDTIITGVRAYNTRDILKQAQERLLDYVKNGGRLVEQYNVSRGLNIPELGPYPLHLSSNRVCEEDAEITVLDTSHPLMRIPNIISDIDFEGWVQERGLYFADQWDDQYSPFLMCNDSGEESQKGSLLLAHYGKGVFVYTGLSFFRQLPAGVPGAMKLFINIISSNKTN